MTKLTDTSPDVARAQLELLRLKTPAERAALVASLSSEVIRASKRAIARRYPELTPREVGHMFIELHYGKALADEVRRTDPKFG